MRNLSIVVPTYNEEKNIRPLVERINKSLDGIKAEIIFVDDSTDQTPNIIGELMREHKNIRLIHRQGKERNGGLATAVVTGFEAVDGSKYICRLDGDGQHSPEVVKKLLQKARETQADIVIASRYINGGSNAGLDKRFRKIVSVCSRWLAQIIFSKTRGISDLGELYLFKRQVLEGVSLYPGSFKMILSLLVQGHWKTVAEIPYTFQKRRTGKSKATFKQGFVYLNHILQLLWRVPQAGRFWKFALIGGSIMLVGGGILYLFVDILSIEKNLANFILAIISIQMNFWLNNLITWRDRRGSKLLHRLAKFHAVKSITVSVNVILFFLLATVFSFPYLIAYTICVAIITVLNYLANEHIVFRKASDEKGGFNGSPRNLS